MYKVAFFIVSVFLMGPCKGMETKEEGACDKSFSIIFDGKAFDFAAHDPYSHKSFIELITTIWQTKQPYRLDALTTITGVSPTIEFVDDCELGKNLPASADRSPIDHAKILDIEIYTIAAPDPLPDDIKSFLHEHVRDLPIIKDNQARKALNGFVRALAPNLLFARLIIDHDPSGLVLCARGPENRTPPNSPEHRAAWYRSAAASARLTRVPAIRPPAPSLPVEPKPEMLKPAAAPAAAKAVEPAAGDGAAATAPEPAPKTDPRAFPRFVRSGPPGFCAIRKLPMSG